MARIQVTGIIDTDDLPDSAVDLSHETGLSEYGYTAFATSQLKGSSVGALLEDAEFKLLPEDE